MSKVNAIIDAEKMWEKISVPFYIFQDQMKDR